MQALVESPRGIGRVHRVRPHFLSLALGLIHRQSARGEVYGSAGLTVAWFTLAVLFAASAGVWRGRREALEFFTGTSSRSRCPWTTFFVIAADFAYFRVPAEYQPPRAFLGILGALLMRGVMIWLDRTHQPLRLALCTFLAVSGGHRP